MSTLFLLIIAFLAAIGLPYFFGLPLAGVIVAWVIFRPSKEPKDGPQETRSASL